MKKLFLFLLLFLSGTASFCTTWQITNSGTTYVPATVTIAFGDSVNFTLAVTHDALEVNQATWNANGSTPLPGGFHVPFGGGLLLPAQLPVGTHYYVCSNHVGLGMKGMIIVQDNSGISINKLPGDLFVYPNPAHNLVTIQTSKDLAGSQYLISDQKGTQVLDGKLANEATSVDISQLSPGIYLIQVVGQRKLSIKMVKN
jgi:plastocyanin